MWFEQHEGFLNERTVNEETGSSRYTHKTLRSAYLSLKQNLDYLFTFEAHPELGWCPKKYAASNAPVIDIRLLSKPGNSGNYSPH